MNIGLLNFVAVLTILSVSVMMPDQNRATVQSTSHEPPCRVTIVMIPQTVMNKAQLNPCDSSTIYSIKADRTLADEMAKLELDTMAREDIITSGKANSAYYSRIPKALCGAINRPEPPSDPDPRSIHIRNKGRHLIFLGNFSYYV